MLAKSETCTKWYVFFSFNNFIELETVFNRKFMWKSNSNLQMVEVTAAISEISTASHQTSHQTSSLDNKASGLPTA